MWQKWFSVYETLLGLTHPTGSMYRESPFGIMYYRKSSPGPRLPGVPGWEKEEHPGRALPAGYISNWVWEQFW